MVKVRYPISARRVGGANLNRSSRPSSIRPSKDQVTTATLLRGRVYFYKNVPFEKGAPLAIDDELIRIYHLDTPSPEIFAQELDDLYETVTDSDGEEFDKPIFEIRHNQPKPLNAMEERAARPRRIKQYVEITPNEQRRERDNLRISPRRPGRPPISSRY